MKETERDIRQKSRISRLFSMFRKDGGVPAEQASSPAPPQPDEPSEEELAQIEAERIRKTQELIRREKECLIKAASSRLYHIYQLHYGQAPVTDDDGLYSLAVFMENGALPTDEQRALLVALDRDLAAEQEQVFEESVRSDASDGVQQADEALSGAGALEEIAPAQKQDEPAEREPARADCRILIPEKALRGYLFVLPAHDSRNGFTKADVENKLRESQVTFGLMDEKVDIAVRGQKLLTLIEVASGIDPVDGMHGAVEDCYSREVEIRLKEKEDGTIDYRDLGWLQTAKEGDLICELLPPSPPQDGTNVFGEPVQGNPGEEAKLPQGQGVVLSSDGRQMLAAMDGTVLFQKNCFHVEPLLIIENDVDTGVGNLDIVGSLIVYGNVRGGYSIKASGNITIQGGIENAVLEAGGSIQVGNGMSGNQTGVMRAQGDIACRYLEYCDVSAGHRVISDSIINSNVSAGNSIEVMTGRGTIVGGRMVARNRVQAQIIGNLGSTPTVVILGDTLENLAEKQEYTQKKITLTKELNDSEKNLKHLTQRSVLSSSDRTKLAQLKDSVLLLRVYLDEADARLAEIEQNHPPATGCYLRAGTVHPPLELTIDGTRTVIRNQTLGVRMVMRAGEVVQIPY